MRSYLALLRGINVGPHKQVDMGELRRIVAQLGFADARSLLRTGNLVFQCLARSCAQLERLLEAEVQRHLDLETKFFVRTAEEWQAVIASKPRPAALVRRPSVLVFLLMYNVQRSPEVVRPYRPSVASLRK